MLLIIVKLRGYSIYETTLWILCSIDYVLLLSMRNHHPRSRTPSSRHHDITWTCHVVREDVKGYLGHLKLHRQDDLWMFATSWSKKEDVSNCAPILHSKKPSILCVCKITFHLSVSHHHHGLSKAPSTAWKSAKEGQDFHYYIVTITPIVGNWFE